MKITEIRRRGRSIVLFEESGAEVGFKIEKVRVGSEGESK